MQADRAMVLDIHHQWVNNDGEAPWELWPDILRTWETLAQADSTGRLPRPRFTYPVPRALPISAMRGGCRAIAGVLRNIAGATSKVDVMIEAKMKDGALFDLMKDLGDYTEEGVTILDGASIEVNP